MRGEAAGAMADQVLAVAADAFTVQPALASGETRKNVMSMVIDRHGRTEEAQWSVSAAMRPPLMINFVDVFPVYGVFGLIQLLETAYLGVVVDATYVGAVQGSAIYRVDRVRRGSS